jgi:hypothetical protein
MFSLKNVCFAEFRRFRQSLISPLIPDLSMYARDCKRSSKDDKKKESDQST